MITNAITAIKSLRLRRMWEYINNRII